jgi:hypothetical protein
VRVTEAAPFLGVLAGLLGVFDTLPYIRDTLRGATRPHRGTWLIWTVLGVVVCLSQRADGASWSLVMVAVQALATVVIFVLAIPRGEGGLSRFDVLMMSIALGGVTGWVLADEPLVATACVVAADSIGVALMVPKTWRDPDSETLITFALASLAGMLAVGAVAALDPALLLYPAYYCLANGFIALLIVSRRAAVRPSSTTTATAAASASAAPAHSAWWKPST